MDTDNKLRHLYKLFYKHVKSDCARKYALSSVLTEVVDQLNMSCHRGIDDWISSENNIRNFEKKYIMAIQENKDHTDINNHGLNKIRDEVCCASDSTMGTIWRVYDNDDENGFQYLGVDLQNLINKLSNELINKNNTKLCSKFKEYIDENNRIYIDKSISKLNTKINYVVEIDVASAISNIDIDAKITKLINENTNETLNNNINYLFSLVFLLICSSIYLNIKIYLV
jgi:hypothetical protein